MILVMNSKASQKELDYVIAKVTERGLRAHVSEGKECTIVGLIGEKDIIAEFNGEALPGVEKALAVTESYKLASRKFKEADTVVNVGGVFVGGNNIAVMAGPCAVESREQLLESAWAVKSGGAQFLRGGAFKPRTSPYAFQGLEEVGLRMLAEVGKITGLKIVTEVVDVGSLPVVCEYADMLQVGARNMQNFQLLKAIGKLGKPVLLKRGLSATLDEWLNAAEYILNEGNCNVIMCERGIRTFENYTRNTLDLSAVAALKLLTHLPVVVDPSHGTGRWKLVAPMARAAVAAGADGLMIEVHPCPANALSDGPQSLTPDNFTSLMLEVAAVAGAIGRKLQ
ncbi:MAG: phospho-2-dehydro-3-deoxyheptonate aldolase [Firmicutes bacterium]|nr:phospho-2-dehydro-3-deoxyheptonate aldolase [Bacillota bacterium]